VIRSDDAICSRNQKSTTYPCEQIEKSFRERIAERNDCFPFLLCIHCHLNSLLHVDKAAGMSDQDVDEVRETLRLHDFAVWMTIATEHGTHPMFSRTLPPAVPGHDKINFLVKNTGFLVADILCATHVQSNSTTVIERALVARSG
jgi:hypothetical protein